MERPKLRLRTMCSVVSPICFGLTLCQPKLNTKLKISSTSSTITEGSTVQPEALNTKFNRAGASQIAATDQRHGGAVQVSSVVCIFEEAMLSSLILTPR